MQLADYHTSFTRVPEPTQKISGWNRQCYQRLKRALSLGLRRQIFVAVCDDLTLRDRLAARLHAELAYPAAFQRSQSSDRQVADYPELVTLNLNLNNPNLIAQVDQWLVRHPVPSGIDGNLQPPNFQILGIERLTRQSAGIQRLFLSYLQNCERNLPALDVSLLLWVPQPWFRAIQQSAPEFWNWRTGVFEFVGDPTPLAGAATHPPRLQPVRSKKSAKSAAIAAAHESTPPPTPTATEDTSPTINLRDLFAEELADLGDLDPEAILDTIAGEVLSDPAADASESNSGWVREQLPAASPVSAIAPTLPARSGFQPTEAEQVDTETPAEDETAIASVAIANTSPATIANSVEPLVPLPTELVTLLVTTVVQGLAPDFDSQVLLPVRSLAQVSAQLPPELAAAFTADPAIRLLQHTEQLHQQATSPDALAVSYRTLGNVYRDRLEQGQSSPQLLAIAIQAYEQALSYLDATSPLGPDILNDLGNLYWMLSRFPPQPEQQLAYLEQGIAAYHLALEHVNPQEQPQSYAMIQNNLGAVYGELARYREPAEQLQRSIAAYQEALRYRTSDAEPLKYASTQNNLGTAHWNLAQHQQPAVNLKLAIVSYTEALNYYDPDRDSLAYAMIQNNLGTAYWNLAQYEQPYEFLTLAISCYRIALMYRTATTNPAAYAATQNNLGTAYWHLASRSKDEPEQRQQALQNAIAAYKAALETVKALTETTSPGSLRLSFDVSATYNNLGLAHYQVATDTHNSLSTSDRSTQLEAALDQHLQAWQGWQKQPDYARTALNYVVQTVRAFYSECGLPGQNLALSRIPGHLLPEILPRL